ncbi:iduronate sulfatase [Bacillus nakamurai]|uniref:Iduronate sulfatase n=1 Tax=Bacillus nakamurai TaxID=1793963 RepID=A0A150F3V2_9BACI|nr:helix-turn-helix transcriptional regulator [Bacillus nakamurai]KXZ15326.1 iduronate sulfatase [Bacillus nakamurai]KXZ16712.1 iduronate sulfatase [Bacillus nakamurai]MED1226923.1 helix-turn-helix transcriptional regulator [Bacillus nakamurai]
MLDKKNLGYSIKSKRKEKNMNQSELASLTGLSRTYISDIENGRYLPGTNSLSKIAICIDLDLNVLKMTEIQVVEEELHDRTTSTC